MSTLRNKHKRAAIMECLEPRTMLTSLPTGFGESVISGNLGDVTAMDVLPDGRILVCDQSGTLEIVPAAGGTANTALTLTVDSNGERGLIGVTHDPQFTSNHFIYLYHTVPLNGSAAPFNQVTRYTLTNDIADPASALDILKLNDLSDAGNHNGGSMHFGPDGMLYIGVGENADADNSQTLSNLLGKILRIDVSLSMPGDPVNDVAKLIPADNPFVATATGINQAIYALGVRNPFTFAVNPNGTIYLNDVGQNTWEEIDRLKPGGNYGWGLAEGFAARTPAGLGPGQYTNPLLAYNHNGGRAGGGNAILGGVLYKAPPGAPNPFPSTFNGKYFYADLTHDWIRIFDAAKPGSKRNPDTSSAFATGIVDSPVGLAQAPDGGIYYLARGNGGQLLEISAISPTITLQPADISITVGQNATFTVTAASPAALRYQWQRSSGGAFAAIPGATGSSLTLKKVSLSKNGWQYRVIVRSAGRKITSDAATLTVLPPSSAVSTTSADPLVSPERRP